MRVSFDESLPPIECSSVAEVNLILDRLDAQCGPNAPILVCIDTPTHRFDIGLGTDPTFVIVNTQPCDGEFWISRGDPAATGRQDFYGCGVHQQVDVRNLIPMTAAREALNMLMTSGQRWSGVHWEDWNRQPA